MSSRAGGGHRRWVVGRRGGHGGSRHGGGLGEWRVRELRVAGGRGRRFVSHVDGGGTLTWMPVTGRVIHQGGVLYRVDTGVPVSLLYGCR
jgi:hypothetical protein